MKNQITPWMQQHKFVLAISNKGEVRVGWYAFITDVMPQPNMTSGPYVVKLISQNLNTVEGSDGTAMRSNYIGSCRAAIKPPTICDPGERQSTLGTSRVIPSDPL